MEDRFNFYHLDRLTFPFFQKKSTKELLTKWSMVDGMLMQGFSFDRPFKTYLQRDFVQDFFTNANVISTLQRSTHHHSFVPLGIPGETVKMKEIPCTLTSMTLFDRLTGPVTRECAGSIRKCPSEYYKHYDEGGDMKNEIEVSDELRKMILFPEESDAGELYSTAEKDEFLFRIFKHLVIGGSLCQFEDFVNPYLDLTKGLYKDFISVTKADSGPEILTTSTVMEILSVSCDSFESNRNLLFQGNQYNNFMYLIIDPNKRVCYTWYHNM